MVIVDSTVWIDYFNGHSTPHTEWLEQALDQQRLGLTDFILCEVLQGIRDNQQFDQVHQALLKFEILTMGGLNLALDAAQNYRMLRTKGYTIRRTIDTWIATFCILYEHTLLHNDHDFIPFEKILGLQVIRP